MIQRKRRKIDGEEKPTRYYSSKQEKAVAKRLNGTQQPNSGATMFAKGDVKTDSILIECKTKATSSESINIKKSWIEKNGVEAMFLGKPYNALAFSFGPNEKNYYIIDEDLMAILVEKIEQDL